MLFEKHIMEALNLETVSLDPSLPVPSPEKLVVGGPLTQSYVLNFMGGSDQRLEYGAEAVQATSKFLAPTLFATQKHGYHALEPTLTRDCDFFEQPQVKMVHALGTLAKAHLELYSRLRALDESGRIRSEVPNPWTGLFSPSANDNKVPLLIRFSIANPVAHTIRIGSKSLNLEFIPGIGLKFFVDGEKSVDLIAMESLAGQGTDHNFFKYEFSPDFSGHAPSSFNTSQGSENSAILHRYSQNPVNAEVMDLVGKRFFQAMTAVKHWDPENIDRHSRQGPNPFIISLQPMAAFNRYGHPVDLSEQRRPWRLVFKPALDNVEDARRKFATDSTPYAPGKTNADFRWKLSHLRGGDHLYTVIAETAQGKRYELGRIVLDSAPIPTEFADREYFIHHDLEMARLPDSKSLITDPE